MRTALVAFLFGLLIGIVVGLGARMSRQAVPPAAAADVMVAVARDPVPAALVHQAAPAVATIAATRVAIQDTAVAEPPAATEGSLSIIGSVVDDAGRPLADVVVRAEQYQPWEPAPADFGVPFPDTDDEIDAAIEAQRGRIRSRREGRSAADGSFRIDGLVDQNYHVEARAPGWWIVLEGLDAQSVRPGPPLGLRAKRVVRVPVSIVLPDGRTPARALLSVDGEGSSSLDGQWVWRRDDPFLPLVAGTWLVSAEIHQAMALRIGLDGDWLAPSVRCAVSDSADPVLLKLCPRRGVRGRALLPADRTMPSFEIVLAALAPGESPDPGSFAQSQLRSWYAGNRDERFEFLDVEAGRYALAILADDEILTHEAVEVGDGITACDIEIPAVDPDALLLMRVCTASGSPLDDAHFSYRTENARGSTSGGATAFRRAPGEYALVLDANQRTTLRSPAGSDRMVLTATSERYGRISRPVGPGQREIRFRFEDPGVLRLTLTGAIEGQGTRRIVARLESDGQRDQHSGNHGADPMQIGPVQPGSYQVVVVLQSVGHHLRDIPIHRAPIQIVAGENHLVVPLPALHSLRVRVAGDAGSDAVVDLSSTATRYWTSEGIAAGAVVFEDLVAGEYVVSRRSDHASMRVRVPDAADVSFRPDVVNALRVMITDTEGVLVASGLRDGDLVIEIAGMRFNGFAEFRVAWAALSAHDTVALTVLRGGHSIQVQVDGRRLVRDDVGGRLEPLER